MDNRLTLLVGDDEAIIRKRINMMLGSRFKITEADTAAAVREEVKKTYDAILLDIMFPDGNGIDICREIKKEDPHAVVVISSSMESVDSWNEAFKAGADNYLEKRELLNLDPRKTALMIENLVERNSLRREADKVSKRRVELLSVLSHDVRAPFQAIMGTIELLKKKKMPDYAGESVEMLYNCVKDQLAFINSLLELLRLESGAQIYNPRNIDLNLPVRQSLQMIGVTAKGKSIAVNFTAEPNVPKINGDISVICRLCNNLLANAVKFTPRGGSIEVELSLEERSGQTGVSLSVADTGVGVRPTERDKIFSTFYRGRDKGTDGETGTGLGLSICNEILKMHGGFIGLKDNSGGGAIFTAWFPAATSEVILSRPGPANTRSAVSR